MFIEVLNSGHTVVSGEACPAFIPGSKSYSPQLTAVIASYGAGGPNAFGKTNYFTVASVAAGGPSFRVQSSELKGGNLLIVADPISGVSNTLGQLLLLEGLVTGGALLASILVGLWLVRLGLRPLRDVVQTAEAITGGDLVHRVPNANTHTEMGRVADAINVMLERIQSGFAELQASESRLRRFVSDASHELRTPIAAVSAYAQLFKYGATRSEPEMGRVMSGIEHETSRMARLVEDLLVLARFDEERESVYELVELVGLTMESVATARLVGPQWPIDVEAIDVVEVMGDPLALRQVVDNLLKNVRAHTPSGTAVTVRVRQVGHEAVIEVEDEGPGLTDYDAELVFERFFRADPSRSRDTGGAGLGLAIVASIVRSHAGRVDVRRGRAGGADFLVTLPLAQGDPRPAMVSV
jgi:two-component system OmpR family sensor kinase